MISTNKVLVDFIINNLFLILLLGISIARVVPPEWGGFWKYNNNDEKQGRAPRITILNFILTSFFESIIRSFVLPILASFGLKNMVTLIIFIVVIFDIFVRNEISNAAVVLIGIGIITLYLESLIERGKILKFFGGLLYWEKESLSTILPTETKKK